MAQQQLKIGDVVELISGSPDLTVAAINGDMVEVAWINPEDSRHYMETLPKVCFRRTEKA